MLETDDPVNHEAEDDISGDIVGDVEGDIDLSNEPVTKAEVTRALISLENGKVPGPDGIIGEMLKNASDVVLDFFVVVVVILFSEIFDKGIYLENWTDSIIHPLHKKGNPNDPHNYRGISLSDVSRKLFSTIINLRLQMWFDMNDVIGEQKAGFSLKDYSTVDQKFSLLAIVQKQLSLNRKLYDFQKAIGSVSRNYYGQFCKSMVFVVNCFVV